jgi:hypothetical protein
VQNLSKPALAVTGGGRSRGARILAVPDGIVSES